MIKNTLILSALILSLSPLALAADKSAKSGKADKASEPITVELKNAKGESAGTATLTETNKGVHLSVKATGLTPGEHGIHFHETGKCDAPDFKSAGSHFNPSHKEHGLKNPKGAHEGDMPNLKIGEDGTGTYEHTTKHVTLKSGKKNSLLKEGGTALVIHAKPDDQMSQPAGDAGDRIACGVIAQSAAAADTASASTGK